VIEIFGVAMALGAVAAVVIRPHVACVTSALGLLMLCMAGIGLYAGAKSPEWIAPAIALGTVLTAAGLTLERRKQSC
jgi:hypothetical protein